MINIKKATHNDYNGVNKLLTDFYGNNTTNSTWSFFFNEKINAGVPGYIIEHNAEIVGFVGTFNSERIIKNRKVRACNLSSAYIKDSFRKYTMKLMKEIISNNFDYYTSLTPIPLVAKGLVKFFKFKILDSTILVIPRFFQFERNTTYFLTSPKIIFTILSKAEQELFRLHSIEGCYHFAFVTNSEYCYIIYTKIEKYNLKFLHLHYISNKLIFKKYYIKICSFLLKENKMFFALVDSRFWYGKKPKFAFPYKLKTPKLYRSNNINPNEIDNLFTEFVFLDFFKW